MEKKLVNKTVLNLYSREPITWKFIKDFKFEDNDIIRIGYVEPWENGSSNSGGDHYEVDIIRQRLETDEEFNNRVHDVERDKKWAKEQRYENYLKQKKEFEDEN